MVDVPANGPTWRAVSHVDDQVIVGIDEVGRGCWAGPVVSGAVVLPFGTELEKLNDSKVLSKRARVGLDRTIRRYALAIGLGWVGAHEVDAFGLSWAVRESGLRALAAIPLVPDLVVLDGRHNFLEDRYPSRAIVKADALVVPVAAASVVAKVARDRYMELMHRRYPHHAFDRHVGYGTPAHRQALETRGDTDLHRRSYKPIKEFL